MTKHVFAGFLALSAFVVPSLGLEVIIGPEFASTENTGARGLLTLEFSDHGDEDILTIVIQNTTSPKIGSKLTAVGLEMPDFLIVPPTLVPAVANAYFSEITYDADFEPFQLSAPGGFDIVLTAEGNFLGGNPQGSPGAGERESVVLSLGDTGMSPAALNLAFFDFYSDFDGPFAVGRFQVVGPNGDGSDKVGSGVGVIPEPTMLTLLAFGAGALLHRKRC